MIKLSSGKASKPGRKQVFRGPDGDVLGLRDEPVPATSTSRCSSPHAQRSAQRARGLALGRARALPRGPRAPAGVGDPVREPEPIWSATRPRCASSPNRRRPTRYASGGLRADRDGAFGRTIAT